MSTHGPLAPAYALCREYDMFPEGITVLCAVSGGADSVCLLHWLDGLRCVHPFTLIAAHYNHNLRGEESLRDEEFVRTFVSKYCGEKRVLTARGEVLVPSVKLIVGSGDVADEAVRRKAGIEETARDMRYAFLFQTAREVGADRIATAHNADDNVETLLLHLIRGTGLRGLTGIPPRRSNLIRPLLTTPRSAIEEYLRIYSLPHVEDSSNRDESFTRNRVRHQLIPLVNELNPGFTARITDTIRSLREDEEYLTQQARQACIQAQTIPNGVSMDAPTVAGLPDALAVRVIRMLMGRLTHENDNCTSAHLHAVAALCRGDSPSAQATLPHGLTARRVYDRLELTCEAKLPTFAEAVLSLPGEVILPNVHISLRRETYDGSTHTPFSFYLACNRITHPLILRSRRVGDTMTRPGRHKRTLKKLMIDEKIPRHLREHLPVLDCSGQIAGVIGIGPDAAFLPLPGEPCWHIQCQTVNTQRPMKGSVLSEL